MKHASELTQVIYRKFPEGDIIALFPLEAADLDGNIMSYMRVGQHSAASAELIEDLEPCTFEEAFKLHTELESIGYDLEVLS